MGTLYLVSTPIGNLEDMTMRAVRILGQVRLIAAEDTRQTRKLLGHYHIQAKLTSFHEHNWRAKLEQVLAELEAGDVALVSDAGTPTINDPGYELVNAAVAAGHPVSPIPGPSAPIAALAAAGLPSDAFLYLGYLPRKHGERRKLLQQHTDTPYTIVVLETPHRLNAALADLAEILGDREICVAREMTKLHEEFTRGPASEVRRHFLERPARGEITLVIAGSPSSTGRWSEEEIRSALEEALDQDASTSQIAAQIAGHSGWKKREVYNILLELQSQKD
jgi:16S rRNA (cytidine1402-2'-O)-methyltransferase